MRGPEACGRGSSHTRRLRLLVRVNFGNGAAGFIVIAPIIVTIAFLAETNPIDLGFELMLVIAVESLGWILTRLDRSTLRAEIECLLEMKSQERFSDILVRLKSAAPQPTTCAAYLDEMVRQGALRNTENG